MVARQGVRQETFFDKGEPAVAVVEQVFGVGALERAALVLATVAVEVLQRDSVIGVHLVGEVGHRAELGALGAILHVVIADRLELVIVTNAVEGAFFLDVLFLVRLGHAGDDTELAETVAEHGAPVLAGRAVGAHRAPRVTQLPAVVGNLLRRVADLGRVDAAAHDLVVGDAGRQGAGPVVEAEPIPVAERAQRQRLAGRVRITGEAIRERHDGPAGELDGVDLHQAAGEFRRAIWRVRLAHLHAIEEAGREQIERHHFLVRFGRRQRRARQRCVAVTLAQAADEHILVVDHRQAGHARHRGGRIGIGVLLHFLRAEVVADDRGRLALDHLRLGGRGDGTEESIGRDGHGFSESAHLQADVGVDHARAGRHIDLDETGLVAVHRDFDLVGTRGQLKQEAAIHVGIDRCGAGHFNRNARQGDVVGLVPDHAGHPDFSDGGRLTGRFGDYRHDCAGQQPAR